MGRAHRTHQKLSLCLWEKVNTPVTWPIARLLSREAATTISKEMFVLLFSFSALSNRRVRPWNGAGRKERYSKTRITMHMHRHALHTSTTNHVSSPFQAPGVIALTSTEEEKTLNMTWDWHILKLWNLPKRFATPWEKMIWNRIHREETWDNNTDSCSCLKFMFEPHWMKSPQ